MTCYNKDCSHCFEGKCENKIVIKNEMTCLSVMNKSK
jgi:hypothetical protein